MPLKIPYLRWWIAAILVCGSVLNYMDRISLSVVAPQLRQAFQLSNTDYALIVNFFLLAYTISYTFGGRIADIIGPGRAVWITISCWSVANGLHAAATGLWSLCIYRGLLGLGEASFYPAAIKAIGEWFLVRDRAKAIGLLLAGLSIGAVIAPPVVASITLWYGWRAAFIFTGALGFLLLPPWFWIYRQPERHPRLTPQEAEYLHGAAERATAAIGNPATATEQSHTQALPWRKLLGLRQTWALISARCMTDAAWYFYIFWLPEYLVRQRGFDLEMIGRYLWIPFLAADIGGIVGGWASSSLIGRGWSVNSARKSVMVFGASLLPLGILASRVNDPFLALALISVAIFGHMTWGTNLLTLPADIFPAGNVGTVFGMTGSAGSLGGAALQSLIGLILDRTGSYSVVFLIASLLHPTGALIILLALGRVRPI